MTSYWLTLFIQQNLCLTILWYLLLISQHEARNNCDVIKVETFNYDPLLQITVYNTAHSILFIGKFVGSLKQPDSSIRVFLIPETLVQGIDFEVDMMKPENSLPFEFKRSIVSKEETLISLVLKPGRNWIGSSNFAEIRVKSAFQCSFDKEDSMVQSMAVQTISSDVTTLTSTLIARIAVNSNHPCPILPLHPSPNSDYNIFINKKLMNCNDKNEVIIIPSKQLSTTPLNSLLLLSFNKPLILIDGSDQLFSNVIKAVDNFLGRYSVLYMIWEPYDAKDPLWFVLCPYPRGMPGHLAAIVDTIQYQNPYIMKYLGINSTQHHIIKKKRKEQCTLNITTNCLMGCPKTWLSRITGSGWGADSYHLQLDVRRAVLYNSPYQAAPMTLGLKKSLLSDENLWDIGSQGWSYTYGKCKSNFLDCYFLSHSPCPTVQVDPYKVLKKERRSRVRSWNTKMGDNDRNRIVKSNEWWSSVMHDEYLSHYKNVYKSKEFLQNLIEEIHFMKKITDFAPGHFFKTYMLRPNYELRKYVFEQKKMFNLNEKCAVLHLRRGDIMGNSAVGKLNILLIIWMMTSRVLSD